MHTHAPGRPRRRDPQAGFTLVEALTAVVILSFGIMAVTNLLVVAAASNGTANKSTAATMAAVQQMEALKAMDWGSTPTPPAGELPVPGAGTTLGAVDVDAAGYYADVSVVMAGEVARTPVHLRWSITGIDAWTVLIHVRAEAAGPGGAPMPLAGARTRAEFTTIRSCTTGQPSCP